MKCKCGGTIQKFGMWLRCRICKRGKIYRDYIVRAPPVLIGKCMIK